MGKNKLSGGIIDGAVNVVKGAVAQAQQIVSLTPVAKYMSGARCTLKVNDKLIGFAFGISWSITTAASEIRTIDDYLPYELAPKLIRVNGTISSLRIPTAGLLDDTDAPMQANIVNFLQQKYITIEVRDSQTDALIFMTRRAMITGRREDVRSEDLSSVILEWTAIGYLDEQQISKVVDAATYAAERRAAAAEEAGRKRADENTAKIKSLQEELDKGEKAAAQRTEFTKTYNDIRDKVNAKKEEIGKIQEKLNKNNDIRTRLQQDPDALTDGSVSSQVQLA